MTWITDIENLIETTEQEVATWVVMIKNAEAVIATDVAAAIKWIVGEIPAIVVDLQMAISIIEGLGIGTVPGIAALIAEANAAVAALNAFEAQAQSGATIAQAVVSGYQAVKAAQAAVATATATAVASPVNKAA